MADYDQNAIDGDDFVQKGATDGTHIGNIGDSSKVTEALNTSAVYGSLTVGTTAVEVKVGGSVLANRKTVTLQPKDNKIFWGYDSSVTVSNGTQVFKDQFMPLPVGANISIWLISDGAGRDVRIGEIA